MKYKKILKGYAILTNAYLSDLLVSAAVFEGF